MIFRVFNTFDEIKEIWLKFERNAEMYAFQRFDWLSNWHYEIGAKEGIKPQIIIIKNEKDEIISIMPFGISKIGFMRCLTWLGGKATDYHCPLISKTFKKEFPNINDILNSLRKLLPPFDLFLFNKQPEFIGDIRNPFVFEKCKPYKVDSHSSILENNWESYYKKHANSKSRSTDRRKQNRLKEKGELIFEIAVDEIDRFNITKKMIEQKSRRYIEKNSKDWFRNKNHKNFYLSLTQNYKINSLKVHILSLKLNGEVIATHWGLIDSKRFYYLMPTDAGGELKKYSPGRLVLLHLIKLCFERQIRVFDFTIGDESYKSKWCDNHQKLYKYYRSTTINGLLMVFYDTVITYIKKHDYLYVLTKKIKSILHK